MTMSTDFTIHVYGHAWVQQMLQKVVLSGRTHHAYLFTGPDQIGKTTLARAYAQAVTCEAPRPGDGLGACGHCRSCRLAAEGGHPDHRYITANNGQIKIEAMRNLIREANLSPVEGRYKVFVIRSFERANPHAANALLKTLEEPSETTLILLTSNQAVSLLPTITSRCQVLHLRPLPVRTIATALQSAWEITEDRAKLLANLSGGRMGWAIQVGTAPEQWRIREQRIEKMTELVQQGVVERMVYAERMATASDIRETLHEWLMWWRDVLFWQRGCDDLVINRDQLDTIRHLAEDLDPAEVRRFMEATLETSTYLHKNINMRLAIEALLLKLPYSA